MSHKPFVYDIGLLTECATSTFANRLLSGSKGSDDDNETPAASCMLLLEQHTLHFGRRPLQSVDEDYETRMNNFVRNVVFVHNHNTQAQAADDATFRVGLNRFSDLRLNQILPEVVELEEEDTGGEEDEDADEMPPKKKHHGLHRKHHNRWFEAAAILEEMAQNQNNTGNNNNNNIININGIDLDSNFLTLFSSHQQIMDVAAKFMAMSKGGGGLHNTNNNNDISNENNHLGQKPKMTIKDLYLPTFNDRRHPPPPLEPFEAGPDVSKNHKSGFLLSIKSNDNNKQGNNQKKNHNNGGDGGDDDDGDYDITDGPAAVGTIGDGQDFTKYLNWATTDNPDGVPLVHEPIDQGACGSCWAYVAAGSVEASAARSAALDAYQGFKSTSSSASSSSGRTNTRHRGSSIYFVNNNNNNNKAATVATVPLDDIEALKNARQVEHDAMKMLNLSIQELIDCDTSADEGCTGGNPILAFFYIHRYGLVSWNQYPYVAEEKTCKAEWTRDPLATVQSWGILTPNHESQMELVLRYIGPIAVGLNGGADSFLSYSGGIYSNPTCKHGANHAMLVVGYGQETDSRTGHATKYWIARNSWGKGWGEDGYVRIARGQGKGGVCGLEKAPSVALGGVLVGNHGLDKYRNFASFSKNKKNYDMRQSSLHQYSGNDNMSSNPSLAILCEHIGFGIDSSCVQVATWFPQHKPLCFGLSAMFCFAMAVWLLTMDGRRAQRRRRRRRQQRASSESPPVSHESFSQHEASPLLDATTTQPSYTVLPTVY